MNRLIFTALLLITSSPVYAGSGQIGTKAPSFALPDVNGAMVSLEQFKGKVVFLDFWAPWCIPCRQELPELDKLYKKFSSAGLEVIAISIDASEKNTAAFLQKTSLSVHIAVDKKSEVSDAYRVSSLPTGFIIGRDGVIHWVRKGFSNKDLVSYEKEINALLKQ